MSIGEPNKVQQIYQQSSSSSSSQSINSSGAQQPRYIYSIATSSAMASQTHSGGTATSVNQQNAQGVQQQQLHLQQPTTTTIQGAHQAGAHNQMQPLQVIQQPLQNQALMPHQFFNTQTGQLLMPGNIAFHPGLNPQIQQAQITPSIQLIASAGKGIQPAQLSAQNMFTAATSYTIPTSAANNQAYIIGQLNSHPSILQQQQTSKPGEMQKVIQPQLGTTAQIPTQSIWAIPQYLNQNSILIRGSEPNQMFIQQQQPLHNNTSTHQQFTMPLTTGQLPSTSISSATANGVQQVTQQQQAQLQQAHNQQQSQQSQQQGQSQNQPQIATSNIVSIKAPATLQPKPPLQIQPQPAPNQNANQNQHQQSQQQQQQNQQQQQQNQQQQQLQQQTQLMQNQLQHVAMAHQNQIMLSQTSQNNMIQQQILSQTQGLTQVMQQAQQGLQQRQLTILPQGATQQLQQPVTLIQQQPQQQQQQQQSNQHQPQPIRPNYSTATVTNTTQPQGITTTATPTQRAKIRKLGVGRGSANASPTQQGKTMAPRPTFPNSISPMNAPQLKPAPSPQQNVGATLTKVAPQLSTQSQQSSPVNNQPLKTINIAALHTPPNLPDATLTPLMPQATSQQGQGIQQANPPQQVQVFPAATTQLPSPNISITPAPPPKKEEVNNDNTQQQPPPPQQHQSQQNHNSSQHNAESKGENEKENTKTDTTNEDSEEGSGKQKLPKAMVKPQVLTHVIEGFVIQEASEPFPLGRNGDSDEPPMKKMAMAGEMGKCEMCGKVDLRSKFKKNKRFCSSHCAKGMKAQQHQQSTQPPSAIPNSPMNNVNDNRVKPRGKKLGEGDSSELTDETNSSAGEPSLMSPSQDNGDDEPKVNPVKWNVSEVVDFVRSLPGCSEYADDFAVQEIDGQALMLLKEDHLMSAMGMKLGPALKLCAKIEVIRAGLGCANGEGSQGKS